MTSSRVVRGTKGRILLCICAILIITGIIACYNNTLSQLDDVRRTNDQCHQQQENLSTQLQVIFDYKQRLEKSLKTEKADHQQTKKELERKLNEQRLRYENVTNEANSKFSTLQQHFNLLQTEHDDLKEVKRQQSVKIGELQTELTKTQNLLKQSINDKEKFEHLKSKLLEVQTEKESLQKHLKGVQNSHIRYENDINHLTKVNHELRQQLETLKVKFPEQAKTFETLSEPREDIVKSSPTKHSVNKTNFSKQIDVGDSQYQIRDSQNNPVESKPDPGNVADLPSNAEEAQPAVEQVDVPKTENQVNHIEQFNNNENVLAAPNFAQLQMVNQKLSSTTKSSVNSKAVSKASLDIVQPLHVPTVTPSSLKNKPSQESRILIQDPRVLPLPYAHKKLPSGVVPAPNTHLGMEETDRDVRKTEPEEEIRDDVNNALPNRYRTNLILSELAKENKLIEAEKQEHIKEVHQEGKQQNLLKSDVGDRENNAVEVVDPPINNNDKALDDPFGLDDTHINDKPNVKQPQEKLHKQHVNNILGLEREQANRLYDAQESVDYDKNVQLEENDPDGDDDPEYADPIVRQKEPAVRN